MLIHDGPEDTDTNVAEALKQYRNIGGSAQEIEKVCQKANSIIEAYRAIGSPKEILSTLKESFPKLLISILNWVVVILPLKILLRNTTRL